MKRKASIDYVITIKLRSRNGDKPIVRTVCGNTIFCYLTDGQTATFTVKRKKP